MTRGPTDAEVMRERARIVTRLQLAFPGAEVDVLGIADAATNRVDRWCLKVSKGGQVCEGAMRPDTPLDKAVEAIRKQFSEAIVLTTKKRGEA